MKIKGKISKEDVLELVRKELVLKGIQFDPETLQIVHLSDYDSREFDGVEFEFETLSMPT